MVRVFSFLKTRERTKRANWGPKIDPATGNTAQGNILWIESYWLNLSCRCSMLLIFHNSQFVFFTIQFAWWTPLHDYIDCHNWYVLLCWNSQFFHLHSEEFSHFTAQCMSWRESFRTFMVNGPWNGFKPNRKLDIICFVDNLTWKFYLFLNEESLKYAWPSWSGKGSIDMRILVTASFFLAVRYQTTPVTLKQFSSWSFSGNAHWGKHSTAS